MLLRYYLITSCWTFLVISSEKITESDTNSTNWNKKYLKYLKYIEEAELNYEKCTLKGCDCLTDVIKRDLSPFVKNGIDRELIEKSKPSGTFYQIIDGKIYREKNCMFPARCAGIEYFLLKIAGDIPNVDLVINTRDYPQASVYGSALPVFSFSKTKDFYDIAYPAWSFWDGGPAISLYPTGIGRWDKHRKSLNKAYESIPWDQKRELAFFRGSRTSSERDNLVLLSRDKPNLVDARYTKNQAWKSEKDTLNAPPAKEVSFEDHCTFKYLFNYRGVAASFRHKHLFLCGSLIFHVGDEWTEFYYHAMRPWIHYIPVRKNASKSELEKLINFAKDNDAIVRKIAQAGRDFVYEMLTMSNVVCYWKTLLNDYGKLLRYKPQRLDLLVQIQSNIKTEL